MPLRGTERSDVPTTERTSSLTSAAKRQAEHFATMEVASVVGAMGAPQLQADADLLPGVVLRADAP